MRGGGVGLPLIHGVQAVVTAHMRTEKEWFAERGVGAAAQEVKQRVLPADHKTLPARGRLVSGPSGGRALPKHGAHIAFGHAELLSHLDRTQGALFDHIVYGVFLDFQQVCNLLCGQIAFCHSPASFFPLL